MLINAIFVHHHQPIRVFIENNETFLEWLTNPSSLIALAAIILTFFMLVIQRIHNRKSVTPILAIKTEYDIKNAQNIFVTKLKNCGTGPALIQSCVYVCYKPNLRSEGSNIKDILYDESPKLYDLLDVDNSTTTSLDDKYAIGSNDEITIHHLKFFVGMNKEEIKKDLKSYQLEIKYKSIYGKKFHFKDTID